MNRKIDVSTKIERANVPELDLILGHAFPVLDQGLVRVIDYMGNDAAIVQMARVSYGDGTETPSDDEQLIRYLMRHAHTSPFEGCEIKLHVKMPIFIARQWMRHRMANINEYSGRYSVIKNEFYLPPADRLGPQSKTNKQGTSDAGYDDKVKDFILRVLGATSSEAFEGYESLIAKDIDLSRELARIGLPLNTYTEFYWKIDLHNLFHFLKLRSDPHAQQEIRVYAEAIESIVAKWVPFAYQAWVDYKRDAQTFSRMEMQVLRTYLTPTDCAHLAQTKMSKREIEEFLRKLEIYEARK